MADLAVLERQRTLYVDVASFPVRANVRRDRCIRDLLRNAEPPWRVVELRAWGGRAANVAASPVRCTIC